MVDSLVWNDYSKLYLEEMWKLLKQHSSNAGWTSRSGSISWDLLFLSLILSVPKSWKMAFKIEGLTVFIDKKHHSSRVRNKKKPRAWRSSTPERKNPMPEKKKTRLSLFQRPPGFAGFLAHLLFGFLLVLSYDKCLWIFFSAQLLFTDRCDVKCPSTGNP